MPARSNPPASGRKPRLAPAEHLARECAAARGRLARAGRSLHDDVGPLLAAAGLKLQLLREDVPAAREAARATLEMLEQAMDHVRRLSQELNTSPAERSGLKNALLRLAEQRPEIALTYTETATTAARLPAGCAGALYEAAVAAIDAAAAAGANLIRVSARGSAQIHLRVADDGKPPGRERRLEAARLLARQRGLVFEIAVKKSTIVSIRYAIRRPSGR